MGIKSPPDNTEPEVVVLRTARRAATTAARPYRLSDLPDSIRVLALTMHSVRFGRFENLLVKDGEPWFDPPPRLIRVTRIERTSADSALDVDSGDWALSSHFVKLVEEFGHIENGIISRLEFRHGLPVLIEASVPVNSDALEAIAGKVRSD